MIEQYSVIDIIKILGSCCSLAGLVIFLNLDKKEK